MSDPCPVRVLFRVDRRGPFKGVVTAVFDDRDEHPQLTCFGHIGGHGTASVDWMRGTRPATPEEFAPLLAELRQIGYDVTVGNRLVNYYRAGAR